MEHLRILHPVLYDQIERGPDGKPVVEDRTADMTDPGTPPGPAGI
jgi:hypothetical protein